MLIGIGQTSHAVSSRMQIWSAGYQVRSIKPLEEEKALKDGAEFVGESFIFLVSGTLVVWEYNRSAEATRSKEEKKQAEAKAERAALQAKLIALDARLKAVEDTVKHTSQSILRLGGSSYVEPAAAKLVSIEDDDESVGGDPSPKEETPKDDAPMDKEPADIPATSGSPQNNKPWWKIW